MYSGVSYHHCGMSLCTFSSPDVKQGYISLFCTRSDLLLYVCLNMAPKKPAQYADYTRFRKFPGPAWAKS